MTIIKADAAYDGLVAQIGQVLRDAASTSLIAHWQLGDYIDTFTSASDGAYGAATMATLAKDVEEKFGHKFATSTLYAYRTLRVTYERAELIELAARGIYMGHLKALFSSDPELIAPLRKALEDSTRTTKNNTAVCMSVREFESLSRDMHSKHAQLRADAASAREIPAIDVVDTAKAALPDEVVVDGGPEEVRALLVADVPAAEQQVAAMEAQLAPPTLPALFRRLVTLTVVGDKLVALLAHLGGGEDGILALARSNRSGRIADDLQRMNAAAAPDKDADLTAAIAKGHQNTYTTSPVNVFRRLDESLTKTSALLVEAHKAYDEIGKIGYDSTREIDNLSSSVSATLGGARTLESRAQSAVDLCTKLEQALGQMRSLLST